MGHTQESQCLAHNFPILFPGKIKSYLRDKLYWLSSTCFPVKRSQISACPQQVYFFQKGEKVLTMVQSSSRNSGVLFSHFVPCKSEKVNTSLLGTEMISLSLSLPRRKSRAVVQEYFLPHHHSPFDYTTSHYLGSVPFPSVPKGSTVTNIPFISIELC